MPIRREFRNYYGHHWRTVIRPRILRRAGGRFDADGRYLGSARCERCKAEDGSWVINHPDHEGIYFEFPGGNARRYETGRPVRLRRLPPGLLSCKLIRIQIGVAHLNHTPGDDRNENLAALCRRCHLSYDEAHHRESRARRKDAARPLLAGQEAA